MFGWAGVWADIFLFIYVGFSLSLCKFLFSSELLWACDFQLLALKRSTKVKVGEIKCRGLEFHAATAISCLAEEQASFCSFWASVEVSLTFKLLPYGVV